jgi:hypothetical protein
LSLSLAYRAVDKPAEMACVEFPCRAGLPSWGRAAPNIPATTAFPAAPSFKSLQKKGLSLHMRRDLPPTLLKALNGLERGSQELPHLFLGLLKFFTESLKLFTIHFHPSFGGRRKGIGSTKFLLDRLYHVVLLMQRFFSFCHRSQKKFLRKGSISRRGLFSPQQ